MKTYADIQGDGGSQVVEQLVAQRKEISKRLSSFRHLLAIGSGKGGVGKSTLCMQLAYAFCALGKKVAVLDADLNGPSISQIAGMSESLPFPGAEGMLVPQTSDGIAILSMGALLEQGSALKFDSVAEGDSFTWRATKEFSTLAAMLAAAQWGRRDVLLIDLPPGPERTLQFAEFFGEDLNIILASAPSDVSLGVVERSIDAIRNCRVNLMGYIENMDGYLCPDSGQKKPLFPEKTKTNLQIPKLACLAFDPNLAKACDEGMNLEIWQQLASVADLKYIAQNIWEELEEQHEVSLRAL